MEIIFSALYKDEKIKEYNIILTEDNYSMREDSLTKSFTFTESFGNTFISSFMKTLTEENQIQKISIKKGNIEIFILEKPQINSFINIGKDDLVVFLSCITYK